MTTYRVRLSRTAPFLLVAALVLACDDSTAPPAAVAGIHVDPAAALLDAAATGVQLTASAYDAEGGTIEGVTFAWTSSDSGVVAVSATGRATAVATGTARVTAAAEGVSGESELRVSLFDGYFVCDCATGADGDCVPGNDAASGRSPYTAWRSYGRAAAGFPTLPAGDSIRFCAGGAFEVTGDNTERRWVNARCRADAPCVVTSYQAPWGSGDELRPLLTAAEGHGFALEDGGEAEQEEGYVFEGLRLRCTGCETGFGFFLYNDIDDVVLRDIEIDGFGIGVHISESNACGADPGCNGLNERITLTRLRIVNNISQGFLGSAEGLVIEDSYFENNGTRFNLDHNIYIGGSGSDIRISRNELYRSAPDADGACDGVSLVVHGVQSDLVIEDNLIREDPGKANPGCWGIAVDPAYATAERFERVTIRRNEVRSVGNLGIGVAACVDCLIENNVVILDQAFGGLGIAAPDRSAGAGDAAQTNVDIRNNSIFIAGAGGAGIYNGGLGSDNLVVSNAIHYAGAEVNWWCLEVVVPDGTTPAAVYQAIGHNVCRAPELGAEMVWERGSGTDPDPLTAWQNAYGLGTGSVWADPGFADPAAFDLRSASGSAAVVDVGHPDLSASEDFDALARDGAPDVGAFEWVAGG